MGPTFRFREAVQQYQHFLAMFDGFVDNASATFKEEGGLPGVAFYRLSESSAVYRALGTEFLIEFNYTDLGEPLGVVDVFWLRNEKAHRFLWRTYFDNLGNVRPAPDAGSAGALVDASFLELLLIHSTTQYFRLVRSSPGVKSTTT